MWSSRRQDVIAQSITEAEYIACSEVAKDTSWLQQFLNEGEPEREVLLYTDNEAAIHLIKSQTFHRRTRHIEHKYHYIRQLVQNKKMKVVGIAGKKNPADILMKLIPMSKVREWTKIHGMTG